MATLRPTGTIAAIAERRDATAPIVDISRAIDGSIDVEACVRAFAGTHAVDVQTAPIDSFAHAVSRLADADIRLDPIEQLLVALERSGTLTGRQATLVHGAYLRQAATQRGN